MKFFYGSERLLYTKSINLLVLLFLPCFFLSACHQQPPLEPVDSWKTKVLEAHGGVNALKQVSTVFMRGKIITREDRGTVAIILSRPRKLRTTMRYSMRYEDRILLENGGWRNFGDGFEEAVGHSLDAMIFQYNHLNLPMGLLNDKYKIVYLEQKTDDKILPVLELTVKDAPPMAVVINPETGLIGRVNGKISMGSHEVVMGVDYKDYRNVAGMMLPHQIINYVNGMAVAESRYDTVLVNPEIDQKSFNIGPHEFDQ